MIFKTPRQVKSVAVEHPVKGCGAAFATVRRWDCSTNDIRHIEQASGCNGACSSLSALSGSLS